MARRPTGARTRYVAFRVEGAATMPRQALLRRIEATATRLHGPKFRATSGISLTRYDGHHGLIRCDHHARDAVLAVLEAVDGGNGEDAVRLVPLATSGTIRTLVERHVPALAEPRDTARGRSSGARGGNGA